MWSVIARFGTIGLLVGFGLAGRPALGQEDPSAEDPDAPTERERQPSRATKGQQRLAQTLLAKERALARRERLVGQKQRDLEETQAQLEETLAELTAVREALETLLERIDATNEERITKLVKSLETMRDKSAAACGVGSDSVPRSMRVAMTDTCLRCFSSVVDRMTSTKAGFWNS